MSYTKVNSPEYFAEMFGDTLSAITDSDVIAQHAIDGFFTALKDAEDYHQDALDKLQHFRKALAENLLNVIDERN